jgi:exopolysaccharide biosynthesis polyprenyl glycosylphosphotransferase
VIPLRRKILLQAMKLFDLLIMISCFILAASFESDIEQINFGQFLSMRIKIQNVVIFSGFIFLWHNTLVWFGLYESKRLSLLKGEIVNIIKAVTVGTVLLIVVVTLFRISMASRSFLFFFWLSAGVITITSRIILRLVMEKFRVHGRNLRNIVIVGTNERALQFAKKIETNHELGYHLIGFADDDCPLLRGKVAQTDYSVVSSLKEFPFYLRKNVVDEVMICLPMKSYYKEASDIVVACEDQGIIVRFISDFFNLKIAHITTTTYDDVSIVTLFTGNMVGRSVLIKRFIDMVLSLCLIIALLPLFLMAAILIKLTSPGPVFFVQKRLGVYKRTFGVYKFRTMVPDAEKKQAELENLNEVQGAAFKIKNDPRVTPFGRILRKTSIDELPQLFNVLLGDMSLVGPRPLPIRDYEGFDQDWHRRRFSVRPGITCLWQISGRSGISFDRWMELDMYYIDNWSLWLDFKILLGTIPAVLKGRGAV